MRLDIFLFFTKKDVSTYNKIIFVEYNFENFKKFSLQLTRFLCEHFSLALPSFFLM